MNRKFFLQLMRPVIVSGLLIVVVAGNANAQVEEGLSFNFNKLVIQVSIKGIERQQFLADPVSALRLQGIQVPKAAEAPWREFTRVLRRLQADMASAGRRRSVGTEALHYRIVLKDAFLIFVRTGETNLANSPANSAGSARKFLEDPVGTLRVHGMNVPSVEESDWRQLAEALKAVQLAHARSRSGVERKVPTDSDSALASTKQPTTAMNGSLADGRYSLTALAQTQAQTANDEAFRAVEKQRGLAKQPSGLTSREVAREKAVLQQLEANARRAAEVLESVKRLAAKSDPSQVGDALRLLATVAHNHAQNANQEASLAAEKQRTLVKTSIGKAVGGAANDSEETSQMRRLTSREVAREKAVLQQLEANARRAAEVLESVKKLAAELDRQPRR